MMIPSFELRSELLHMHLLSLLASCFLHDDKKKPKQSSPQEFPNRQRMNHQAEFFSQNLHIKQFLFAAASPVKGKP